MFDPFALVQIHLFARSFVNFYSLQVRSMKLCLLRIEGMSFHRDFFSEKAVIIIKDIHKKHQMSNNLLCR